MSNPLERRIARLEALQPPKSDRIPIFVWNEDDVPNKIEEMIAAGEIAEADRHRCAWWLDIKHRTEWQRQWEDEKLLAEDAARQKARQEQAERDKPEQEQAERQTAEQQMPERHAAEEQRAEVQTAKQQRVEQRTAEQQRAEQQQTEQQQTEQQIAEDQTIDLGTVPPGCL
jgi:hypothetical protein